MTISGDLMETRFLGPFQAQFLSKTFPFTESLEDTPLGLTFPGSGFHSFSWQIPKSGPETVSFLCTSSLFSLVTLNYPKAQKRKAPSLSAQSFNVSKVILPPFVLNQITTLHNVIIFVESLALCKRVTHNENTI